jgi:hypothetical protein
MTDEEILNATKNAFADMLTNGCQVIPVNVGEHKTYGVGYTDDESSQPIFIFLTPEMANEIIVEAMYINLTRH